MRKNILKSVVFVLLVLTVFALSGCTAKTEKSVVVDQLGREITIEGIPERIVSMSPANTEILFALGVGDRVVGVTNYCDYPKEARDIEKVGDAFNANLEVITALEPDVVFSTEGQIVQQLEGLGIPVVAIQPGNLDEVYEAIELIGKVTGKEGEAKELVNNMKERVEAITSLTRDLPDSERPRVYVEVSAGYWTAGPGSFLDDLITLAGGTNIASNLPSPYAQISAEEVIEKDPEVIILTYRDEAVAQRPGFGEITAVKTERVYEVDEDLVSRPGPRIVDGLEAVFKVLHPELSGDN